MWGVDNPPARYESALHMESRRRGEVGRWANTEGSKYYGKFPISRSLNNREIGNWGVGEGGGAVG